MHDYLIAAATAAHKTSLSVLVLCVAGIGAGLWGFFSPRSGLGLKLVAVISIVAFASLAYANYHLGHLPARS